MLQNNKDFEIIAKTYAGLEEVLAKELQELGGRNVKTIKRGVSVKGDLGFLYKANLWCATALRLIVPIASFRIREEDDLYRGIQRIRWEEIFDVHQTFMIDARVFHSIFSNSLFVAQRSKDAIADRFREKRGRRPSVNTQQAQIRINVHIRASEVNISLDSSGESLHKRGYRAAADVAPISEVLAAGILRLTGWKGLQNLVDPMCGSGTFLVEAALMAHHIPPNIFRKHFGFQEWKNYDADLFHLLRDKALEKEKNFHFQIYGFDYDSRVLMKARRNLRSALMEEAVKLEKMDFMNFRKPESMKEGGMLIFNPPYGIKIEADIPVLYKGISDSLKNNFAGYTAWIFTSSQEGLKHLALKPSRKIELYNGKLPSWLVRYDLYEGSRKNS